MDEPPKNVEGSRSLNPLFVVGGVIAVAVVALVLAFSMGWAKIEVTLPKAVAAKSAESELGRFATGGLAKLQIPASPTLATDHTFLAPNGLPTRLDAFRGKVVVANLWAMWCAPCKLEMPTLAALSRSYIDNPDVAVVVVNVDVGDLAPARAFLADQAPLAFYSDPKFQLPFEFGGKGGMPQTVLIDRQGRVRALMTGEADWASPEAKALIDALLAEE